jgi:hypothetical protein
MIITNNIKEFRSKMFEVCDIIEELDNIAFKMNHDEKLYISEYFDAHIHDLKLRLAEIFDWG